MGSDVAGGVQRKQEEEENKAVEICRKIRNKKQLMYINVTHLSSSHNSL